MLFPSFFVHVSGAFSSFNSWMSQWMSNSWVSTFQQHILRNKKNEIGMSRWTWIRQCFGICQQHSEGCHGKKTKRPAFCLCTLLWSLLVTCLRRYQFLPFKFYISQNVGFCLKKNFNNQMVQWFNYFSQSWWKLPMLHQKLNASPAWNKNTLVPNFLGSDCSPNPKKTGLGHLN